MIEIQIGEISKKVPTYFDTFEVVVDYMHGDADSFSTGKHYYASTTQEDLESDLLALHFVSTSPFVNIYDQKKERKAIREFFANAGKTQGDADSFIDRFIIGDVTNDNSNAQVDGFEVFYYNDKSVKFDVTVNIK